MALEYLEKLGRARNQLRDIAKTPVGDVLFKFADTSIKEMKALAPRSEGNLQQSITWVQIEEGGNKGIEFQADDYWDFINSGVDGTVQSSGAIPNRFGTTYSFASHAKVSSSGMSFKESIQTWIIEKGIKAEDGDYESLAYVIMQSVKRKGIKSTPFVNKVLNDEAIEQLQSDVADAFLKMI